MAVEHRIRKNGKGDTYLVKLNSLQAIRKFCLECVGWSADEVKLCSDPLCPLYHFRFGRDPSKKKRVMSEKNRKRFIDMVKNRNESI